MPEGPEVANLADELNFYLTGRQVNSIDIVSGSMTRHGIPESVRRLQTSLPLFIQEVEYRGKLIIIKLGGSADPDGGSADPDGGWWIFSTLGMSGGWYFEKYKHAHIHLHLQPVDDSPLYPRTIYFVDPRCFGTFDATDEETVYYERRDRIKPGFLGKYLLSLKGWRNNIQKHQKKNICKSLMDQTLIVGGIGNYLLSEILHQAAISPWTIWSALSPVEIDNLYHISQKIVLSSYNTRGASIKNYRSMDGEEGESTFDFKVYGRSEDDQGHPVVSLPGPHGRTIWISRKYPWSHPL